MYLVASFGIGPKGFYVADKKTTQDLNESNLAFATMAQRFRTVQYVLINGKWEIMRDSAKV